MRTFAAGDIPRRRDFSDGIAARFRWFAVIAGGLSVGFFMLVAFHEGVPRISESARWEEPAKIATLMVAILGYAIALKWEGVGGGLMVVGAVGFAILAYIGYQPNASVFAALAFFVPGGLFLLRWQRDKSLMPVAVLTVTMAGLLGAGAYASDQVYSHYFGPTHPQSSLEKKPVDIVRWIWAGGVTPESVTVKAKLDDSGIEARLVVSESQDMSSPIYSQYTAASDGSDGIVSITADGLEAGRDYFYAIEAAGQMDLTRQGRFHTFADGAESFSIAFASCARTGSNGSVFDAIRENNPLLFLITGDFHYANITENDRGAFLDAMDTQLEQPAQQALYSNSPIAYVWDDHDFGSDNANGTSDSRSAAAASYRLSVPHYELPDESAIYQAFTVGRVRFIITDTRSQRSPQSARDGPGKTMLGADQKVWFKQQLLDANGKYPLIVWVNPDPWIATATPGSDNWGGYATERQELADFIAGNEIKGLAMLSGDAHMLAIDDGTNSDYSTNGGAGFPVFHAAPLDKHPSEKGGPYSEGVSLASGQFGLMSVADEGETIDVTWSGRNYKNEERLHYEFSLPAAD